jgi:hypothetical protein
LLGFLLIIAWEILLKAIGHPLGAVKRIKESCWEMSKCFWIASGQFLKDIGKPPGNYKKTQKPVGKTFLYGWV